MGEDGGVVPDKDLVILGDEAKADRRLLYDVAGDHVDIAVGASHGVVHSRGAGLADRGTAGGLDETVTKGPPRDGDGPDPPEARVRPAPGVNPGGGCESIG